MNIRSVAGKVSLAKIVYVVHVELLKTFHVYKCQAFQSIPEFNIIFHQNSNYKYTNLYADIGLCTYKILLKIAQQAVEQEIMSMIHLLQELHWYKYRYSSSEWLLLIKPLIGLVIQRTTCLLWLLSFYMNRLLKELACSRPHLLSSVS